MSGPIDNTTKTTTPSVENTHETENNDGLTQNIGDTSNTNDTNEVTSPLEEATNGTNITLEQATEVTVDNNEILETQEENAEVSFLDHITTETKTTLDSKAFLPPLDANQQSGASKLKTDIFSALKENNVTLSDKQTGRVEVDGESYQYAVTLTDWGKGSGASIFVITAHPENATEKEDSGKKVEIVVKEMAKSNMGIKEFDDKQNNALFSEIATLNTMSGSNRSLDFHGAYKNDDENYYVAMEKANEGDLRGKLDSLEERTPDNEGEIKQLIIASAEALLALHEKGIFHGDVKSDNFFISEGSVKLADYGEANTVHAQDEMERFTALAYQIKTGVAPKDGDLAAEIGKKAEKTAFDQALLDCLEHKWSMAELINNLKNVFEM